MDHSKWGIRLLHDLGEPERVLTIKDERLKMVIGKLDAKDKELKKMKKEMAQDSDDLRKLYALAQERIGEAPVEKLNWRQLQLSSNYDIITLHNGAGTGVSSVNNECFSKVRTEVAQFSALTGQLVEEADSLKGLSAFLFDNGPYSSSSLNACCFESKNHCPTADLVAQVSTLIALWYPEDVRLLLPSLLPEFPLPFPEPELIAPITRMLSRPHQQTGIAKQNKFSIQGRALFRVGLKIMGNARIPTPVPRSDRTAMSASSPSTTATPRSHTQTVVIQNPSSVDESGKVVSNVVVGVAT
ncbi:unnamed protein product [Ilex paraguariensis]|uniref:Uncharacterized protein n=1 Tax=Ilex paraguariensis TaxID=185542 RepID=A0ABC8THV6_9AQUA